jgi:dethiobiotin synthetase
MPLLGEPIFITGTDTGVGKTVLTALLLAHLREEGIRALAMKPFSSGDRADIELLHALQDSSVPMEETNPYFFAEPLAPWAAGRRAGRRIRLETVLKKIRAVRARAEVLLVEGCGGVLVPLGPGYTVADLILRLGCRVVVVAPNRLGVINHVLLSVRPLERLRPDRLKVLLMDTPYPDPSASSNADVLRVWLAPIPVQTLPALDFARPEVGSIKKCAKKLKKPLAELLAFDTFPVRSFEKR